MTTPIPLTARPDETNLTGVNDDLILTARPDDLNMTGVNERVGTSSTIQLGYDTRVTRGGNTRVTRGGNTRIAHATFTSTPVFLTARQDDVNLTAREENG